MNNELTPLELDDNRQNATVTGVSQTVYNARKPTSSTEYHTTYEATQSYTFGSTTYDGKAMIQRYWDNYANQSYNFIQKVNWLKLRSISLTYDLTRLISRQNIVKRLSVNLTGQNLFTITNYKGMDPEVSTAGGTGGSGATGIDYCSVPSVRSITFGVNVSF